jgi:hypothetical protein
MSTKKAYILNYDKNENTLHLYDIISRVFDTYIVHNGPSVAGLDHIPDVGKTIQCNSGYSYAIEAANKHFLATDATHALYICSDIIIEDGAIIQSIYDTMPQVNPHTGGNIGMVSPTIWGRCWGQMQPTQKRHRQNMRAVSFVEGICFMADRAIIENIGPITPENTNGWGVDIWLGYLTTTMGFESVVLEEVSILHPEGSSYDIDGARAQMIDYIKSKPHGFQHFCRFLGIV